MGQGRRSNLRVKESPMDECFGINWKEISIRFLFAPIFGRQAFLYFLLVLSIICVISGKY